MNSWGSIINSGSIELKSVFISNNKCSLPQAYSVFNIQSFITCTMPSFKVHKVFNNFYFVLKDSDTWAAQVTCGGHFDSVLDVAWQRGSADFLLSLSADQTTRCHGYWKSCDNEEPVRCLDIFSQRHTHKLMS